MIIFFSRNRQILALTRIGTKMEHSSWFSEPCHNWKFHEIVNFKISLTFIEPCSQCFVRATWKAVASNIVELFMEGRCWLIFLWIFNVKHATMVWISQIKIFLFFNILKAIAGDTMYIFLSICDSKKIIFNILYFSRNRTNFLLLNKLNQRIIVLMKIT